MILIHCFAGALFALPVQAPVKKAPAKAESRTAENAAPTNFVVHAKRVHTATGTILEHGVIVVSNGKITAIGKELATPKDSKVFDADDVTPGLIDANTSAGEEYGGVEDSAEVTPNFHILENFSSSESDFEHLAKSGVTTVFLAPENRNVIGGMAAILKSWPIANPRVMNPEAALKGSFGSEPTFGNFTPRGFGLPNSFHVRRPGSRPGTVMEMRLALFEAQRMVGKLGIVPPEWKPLVDVFEKQAPVRFHAMLLGDIRSALRVVKEFGITNLTIDGATEAHRCIPELKAAGARIVLHPHNIDPMGGVNGTGGRIDFGDESPAQDVLARLAAAGLPTALSAHGARPADDLVEQMRIAVRYGASREVALGAVTRVAAEILGVQDHVGTLAVGKDADLVLWNGDPFELTSAPTAVFVDGQLAWQRSNP